MTGREGKEGIYIYNECQAILLGTRTAPEVPGATAIGATRGGGGGSQDMGNYKVITSIA